MNSLLAFLIFVGLISGVAAMFAPGKFVFWRLQAQRSRKAGLLYLGVMILAFLLFSATMPTSGQTSQSTKAPAAAPASTPAPATPPKTLSLTPAQIVRAFNAQARQFESNLRAGKLTMEEGPIANSGTVVINQYLGMVITQDKQSKKATSVIFIGSGDGTPQSGINVFLGLTQFIAALTPEASPEERRGILQDLGLLDGQNMPKKASSDFQNLHFSMTKSQTLGLMIGVDPK